MRISHMNYPRRHHVKPRSRCCKKKCMACICSYQNLNSTWGNIQLAYSHTPRKGLLSLTVVSQTTVQNLCFKSLCTDSQTFNKIIECKIYLLSSAIIPWQKLVAQNFTRIGFKQKGELVAHNQLLITSINQSINQLELISA